MRSAQQARLFESYTLLVSLTVQMDALDELANQALDDRRLTENQRDALLALFTAKAKGLQVGRAALEEIRWARP